MIFFMLRFVSDGLILILIYVPNIFHRNKNRQNRVTFITITWKYVKCEAWHVVHAAGLFWTIIKHKETFYKNLLHRKVEKKRLRHFEFN